MRPPKICPDCGATLDSCERCECQDSPAPMASHTPQHAKSVIDRSIHATQMALRAATAPNPDELIAARLEHIRHEANAATATEPADVLALCY